MLFRSSLARRLLQAEQRASSPSWSSLVHFISAFGYSFIVSYLISGLILPPWKLTFITVAAAGSPVVLYFRNSIVQLVVRSLSSDFCQTKVNSCHQGIYPTAIFVIVAMRLSAADILSHPGTETHHYPSTIVFPRTSPIAQHSILAMTAGSSSDGDSFVESREDRSTRILESSDPEKVGKIVHAG